MSRRRRSRTRSQSSQPYSLILKPVEQTKPPEPVSAPETIDFEVRYAESEPDMVAIHRFLLWVAKPAMHCDVNVVKSLEEVIRVVRDEVAIMVLVGGDLVGTMGIINPTWWYGDDGFLTDRWHFVLPKYDGTQVSQALMDEAVKIADGANVKFFHQGRARRGKGGVYHMWPRYFGGEKKDE